MTHPTTTCDPGYGEHWHVIWSDAEGNISYSPVLQSSQEVRHYVGDAGAELLSDAEDIRYERHQVWRIDQLLD